MFEITPPQRGNILIYNGPGANEGSCIALKKWLGSMPHEAIAFVSALILKETLWEHSTSLIVFPGGQAGLMINALEDKGLKKIYLYVTTGGKAFCVCAGFYLFSSHSNYCHKDVKVERSIKFPLFSGTTEGPITDPDVATPVLAYTNDHYSGVLYSQGGPKYCTTSKTEVVAFYDSDALSSAKPSLTSTSSETTLLPAVIKEECDDGVVVGCSPHPEFTDPKSRSPIDESEELTHLCDLLSQSSSFNEILKERIIQALTK